MASAQWILSMVGLTAVTNGAIHLQDKRLLAQKRKWVFTLAGTWSPG